MHNLQNHLFNETTKRIYHPKMSSNCGIRQMVIYFLSLLINLHFLGHIFIFLCVCVYGYLSSIYIHRIDGIIQYILFGYGFSHSE